MAHTDGSIKATRLLTLCAWFKEGRTIKKSEAADHFQVAQRSIQRDLDELRCFFAEQIPPGEIVYDSKSRGYFLATQDNRFLNDSEVLAVCKILLESRSMVRGEIRPILEKLIGCCVPEENKNAIMHMVSNEAHHYIEPHHGRPILSNLWGLGTAVREHRVIEIEYERMKEPRIVRRTVEPVGIMFSEYYFYLTAFLRGVNRETEFQNKDDLFPTIYRVDRILSFRGLDEKFSVPYKNRFEEGEFRKRVQFMYGGKLQTVRFLYHGPSVEAVLDRLPTAEILSGQDGNYEIRAEVFGQGIDMWLRSQGQYVTRLDD